MGNAFIYMHVHVCTHGVAESSNLLKNKYINHKSAWKHNHLVKYTSVSACAGLRSCLRELYRPRFTLVFRPDHECAHTRERIHKQSRDYTEDLNKELSIKIQRANIHRAARRSHVHHWSGDCTASPSQGRDAGGSHEIE